MSVHKFTAALGSETITVESGQLAGQAGGAVTIRCGDTMLLVTATMSRQERAGIDFFPLTVDFEERLYAAGRIPGSFFRREGRPTESSILTARLVDRPLRPLFPNDLRNDVQVVITPLSQDTEHYSDILSIIGASAALMISDVPFNGPVGAVRVGYIDGQVAINPTISEMEQSALDLRLAGTADALLMVEAGAKQVSEDIVLEALRLGRDAFQDVVRIQHEMVDAIGKPKRAYTPHSVPPELLGTVQERLGARLAEVLFDADSASARYEALAQLRQELGTASTGAAPTQSAPFRPRRGCCRGHTVRACSHAARPRCSRSPRWARPARSRSSTISRRTRRSATCTTTTSPLIRRAKRDRSAGRVDVR